MLEDAEKPPAGDVTKIDRDSKWNLLPLVLKTTGLTRLQLNSFNDFIEYGLTKIMRANQEVVISESPRVIIRYKSIYVDAPYMPNSKVPLTPQACRLSNTTYAGNVYVDFEYINGKVVKLMSKVQIAKLPIMLQSNRCHLYNATPEVFAKYDECPYDPGCYFIIRGTERVVLVQEQAPYNRILIEASGSDSHAAVVNSSTDTHKTRIELHWKNGNLTLHHNMLQKNEDLPVFIVFRALGVASDQEIIQLIDPEGNITDLLMKSLQESIRLVINTQEEALQYIERRLRQQQISGIVASKEERAMPYYKGREFLRSMFVPHIPSTLTSFHEKAVFFGLMVRWLLLSIRDKTIIDSRDFFGNKRLELAGELLELLFEDLFKNFNMNIQKTIKKIMSRTRAPEPTHIASTMKQKLITDGLNAAISSGNWNITRFKMTRAGVSQPLSRLSYINFLSMVTRISSHFEKTQKVSGARSLYPSQFGFVCPSDTPEGAQCGLVKNFSLTAHVTVWADPTGARKTLFNVGVEEIFLMSGEETLKNYVVILNGEPIGVTSDPLTVCKKFRDARRQEYFSRFIAIWTSPPKRAIFVSSEAGRVCRPLIIVKNRKSMLTKQLLHKIHEGKIGFDTLIDQGIIEYVDVNEQHDCLIAFDESQLPNDDFSHLEIDNAQILGVCAGVIPCPHHNQSPRNTYQCAMGKQAVGPTALNIFNRADKSSYFLCYPQQPMVQTRTIRLSKYNEMPSGQAAMVAIMSYSGHDIEDALVMNKASLDRGFGRRYYLSKLDLLLKRYDEGEKRDIIASKHEDPNLDRSIYQFKALDDDGLVMPGERLEAGQIYANKFVPYGNQYKESRLRYKSKYPVMVHNVSLATSEMGDSIYTIKTRDFRRPELGDKFSSRHGQKGVIGLIVEQEDMPYTETGIYPDIIMNAHGFPSRMTVGKMIELISGKAGLFKGKIGNGTAFSSDRVKDISEDLISAGFSYSGKEMLMSGITGEPLEAYIFFGPVFYQSLKHMVKDKMQARAKGPTTLLTRQPTQGRNREGGMRLGEMERDCLVGYGAANIMYERMLLSSDVYNANVCGKCGFIGYDGFCNECKSKEHMKIVRMPFACKLLFQELMSMGIAPRIRVEDL